MGRFKGIFLSLILLALLTGCGGGSSQNASITVGGADPIGDESGAGQIGDGSGGGSPTPAGAELFVISGGSILSFNPQVTGNSAPLSEFGDYTGLGQPQGIALDNVNNELFVASVWGNVTVYGESSSGNVAPLRTVSLQEFAIPRAVAVDTVNNEMYVAIGASFEGSGSIAVYTRTANGAVTPIRTIGGNETGISDPYGLVVDSVRNELYVLNNGANTITIYGRLSNGNIAPNRTINGGMSFLKGLTVDFANDEIYVAGGDGQINVYPRTANGDVAPTRSISGTATGLKDPRGLMVDPVRNELYVVNFGHAVETSSVTVYSRTASGNAAPIRTIGGASTGLLHPTGGALDAAQGIIVVGNSPDSITVYGQTAEGNVAPTRAISGVASGVRHPLGLAYDKTTGNLFLANNANFTISVYDEQARTEGLPTRTLSGGLYGPAGVDLDSDSGVMVVASVYDSSLKIYETSAAGGNLPLRTIAGAKTLLATPYAVAVDGVNKEIYAANSELFSADPGSITVYSFTDDGDVSPVRTIAGATTGINRPRSVVVDKERNEIFVANIEGDSITVYDRTANGNISPKRMLTGGSTGLSRPSGITLDAVAGEMYVANASSNSITVYPLTANGNVAPLRTIAGSNTGLSHLSGIVLVR